MPIDVLGYLYAATVAAGGVMGYVKAASVPSLGAGLVFGGILGYGAHLNSQEPPQPKVQMWTSVLLAGIMAARWAKSGKVMPAGVVCLISIASVVRSLSTYNYNEVVPVKGN